MGTRANGQEEDRVRNVRGRWLVLLIHPSRVGALQSRCAV